MGVRVCQHDLRWSACPRPSAPQDRDCTLVARQHHVAAVLNVGVASGLSWGVSPESIPPPLNLAPPENMLPLCGGRRGMVLELCSPEHSRCAGRTLRDYTTAARKLYPASIFGVVSGRRPPNSTRSGRKVVKSGLKRTDLGQPRPEVGKRESDLEGEPPPASATELTMFSHPWSSLPSEPSPGGAQNTRRRPALCRRTILGRNHPEIGRSQPKGGRN